MKTVTCSNNEPGVCRGFQLKRQMRTLFCRQWTRCWKHKFVASLFCWNFLHVQLHVLAFVVCYYNPGYAVAQRAWVANGQYVDRVSVSKRTGNGSGTHLIDKSVHCIVCHFVKKCPKVETLANLRHGQKFLVQHERKLPTECFAPITGQRLLLKLICILRTRVAIAW